jgi:hypothetical protein
MEISPQIYETIAFLGQDLVRCKIPVDNKCLHQVKSLNISFVKFPLKMKQIVKEWKEEPVDV